jgi:mono/diheme cytochrome c family protein
MKKLVWLIVLMIMAGIGALAWLGYQLFTEGFSAKTEPHRLEVILARQIRHLAIPVAQRNKPNPVALSPDVLQDGLAHFADHCAGCHGNDGSGNTTIGRNVYPKAPDMRLDDTQSMSDGEMFWVIHNGIRFTGMPGWGEGDPEKDLDSWKLVHFIRHLPKLTREELEQMKSLNPKTKHEMEEAALREQFLSGDDSAAEKAAHGHHH